MDWNPVISAAAALLGAGVGGGAALRVSRDERRERHSNERKAALAGLNAAVGRLSMIYGTWGELRPRRESIIGWIRNGLDLDRVDSWVLERLWAAYDDVIAAIAKAYAFSSDRDIDVLSQVESAMADWELGSPMPEPTRKAIRDLRSMLVAADLRPELRPDLPMRDSSTST